MGAADLQSMGPALQNELICQASGPRHCHKQGQVTVYICKVTGFSHDMGSSSAEEMMKKVMDDGEEERHDPSKKDSSNCSTI